MTRIHGKGTLRERMKLIGIGRVSTKRASGNIPRQ